MKGAGPGLLTSVWSKAEGVVPPPTLSVAITELQYNEIVLGMGFYFRWGQWFLFQMAAVKVGGRIF